MNLKQVVHSNLLFKVCLFHIYEKKTIFDDKRIAVHIIINAVFQKSESAQNTNQYGNSYILYGIHDQRMRNMACSSVTVSV